MSFHFPILRVQLSNFEGVDLVQPLIKKNEFDEMLDVVSILKEAENKANCIIDGATKKAIKIEEHARIAAKKLGDTTYESSVELARIEMFSEMTELSAMAHKFISESESKLIELVTESVAEIVSNFDDRLLVKELVRKGMLQFESTTKIDLWVSPEMCAQVDEGLTSLLLPTVLSVRSDSNLTGSMCRLDNGRMVLDGNISEQVEAVRIAMKHVFSTIAKVD